MSHSAFTMARYNGGRDNCSMRRGHSIDGCSRVRIHRIDLFQRQFNIAGSSMGYGKDYLNVGYLRRGNTWRDYLELYGGKW